MFPMRRFPHARPLVLAAAVLGATACDGAPQRKPPAQISPATEMAPAAQPVLEPVTIRTGRADRRFAVELAVTPEEQAHGLMFRTELASDEGMLFPFQPPKVASFWMMNTLIPLDMLFIRQDGTIARIAAMTKPGNLEPETSGEPVAAVLEIAGGESARQGIKVGDVVRWRGFGPAAN
jgi:uncharacterized protein